MFTETEKLGKKTARSAIQVSAQGGVQLPTLDPEQKSPLPAHCMLGYNPPWTEFLTHTCENITVPQLLLRAVKIPQARWRELLKTLGQGNDFLFRAKYELADVASFGY